MGDKRQNIRDKIRDKDKRYKRQGITDKDKG